MSSQVIFRIPTARGVDYLKAGKKGDLTSMSALNHTGFFVNDTWALGRMTMNAGVRFDRYSGWLPEQEQLAGLVGPVAIDARTFAKDDSYTWNVAAPRLGIIYDLSGTGRTVLKANYGLFWHNPGVGVGSNANPNTPGKQETWTWNDANGDRRWQPGEEVTRTAQALAGSIQLDPNLRQPYTHEVGAWFEQQLVETLGLRTGFVYKTEDDLICNNCQTLRPPSAFTEPFDLVDSVTGRAIPMYGLPTGAAGLATQSVTNFGEYSRFKTVELSMNKRYSNRWSLQAGAAHSWLEDFPNGPQRTPNNPGVEDRTIWNFKLTGSYDGPYGIRFSPVLRHQSGANYARTIIIPSRTGLVTSAGNTVAFAEPMNANREPNITVFDVRADKTVTLSGTLRARLFLDLFNITNSHAAETLTRATGPAFQRPTAILAPRTARLGFRILW